MKPARLLLALLAVSLAASGLRAQRALGAGPVHRYRFAEAAASAPDGASVADSVGSAHGVVRGAGASFTGSGLRLPGGAPATAAYIDLPNGIASGSLSQNPGYAAASYELWTTVHANFNYSRLLDFGANSTGETTALGGTFNGTDYLIVSANVGTAQTIRFERGGSGLTGGSTQDSAGGTILGQRVHLVATYDPAAAAWKLYRNGALLKTAPSLLGPDTLPDLNVWLGRSNWSADSNINATYDEFRIYDYALSDQQILGNYQTGPDSLTSTAPPEAWYEFNETSGTSAASLVGGPAVALSGGANFVAGPSGNALRFDGATSHGRVSDDGALNPASALTLSAWIRPSDWSGSGERVLLQKGSAPLQYRLLASGGLLKFELGDPSRSVTAPLPATGAWSLVVATYDGAALRLYVNGVQTGSAPATGTIAAGTGDLFLGAAPVDAPSADRYAGDLDDLRLYSRALSAIEIKSLVGEPTVAISSPTVAAVALTGAPAQLQLVAVPGGQLSTGLQWSLVSGPASVTFASSTSASTTVRFSAVGTYVLRVTHNNPSGSATAQVTVGVKPAPDANLALWLKFDESSGATAADSSAGARPATLVGSPARMAGLLNNAVSLDGVSQHATLPTGIVSDLSAFTASAWVKLDTVGSWSRILDFGSGTSSYLFITPSAGSGGPVRFAIKSASGSEQTISGAAPLSAGVWTHVAVTQSGALGILYVNGVEVGRNTGLTVAPSGLGSTTQNYLGRSQFASDAYLDGLLDDLRLHRRALSASEVAAFAISAVAPNVSGGTAPAATSGVASTLNGSATVDAGALASTVWTRVSGPGDAAFASASSPSTSVTFNRAGAYVLRLSATNANATVFNDLVVNVASNPHVYADWLAAAYPGQTDEAVVGASADPDGDGAANLLEWALGLDPAAPDATAWSEGRAGLPLAETWSDGTDTYLALQVRRPVGRLSATYSAQATGDLSTWAPAVQVGAPLANGDGTETVLYRDTVPADTASRRFLRLNVTLP
jgi:hypothetical protein